ncbi:hypothetical protein HPC49_51080 [Pyxidicoccus fallax]|uniref:Uncharacterized protein n=1 Tax=Pyxidicoccus fallax TaxID=394095 RepID=A0A848M0K8_9BACT|nr:hypothetical protein [Pyxidicoccus fallax]NMO23399.1 hypothetical protein [Pyxidicoccus fallax]NPC86519.1 hypothetical protein [Pyxidicoccus fallax]
MAHTNPFWLGAVCVVLGALLWMEPSCWGAEPPRPPRPTEPSRTYTHVGWNPLLALGWGR